MKKFFLFFMSALMLPVVTEAKSVKVKEFNDVYIFGQSGRNSQKKGSAVSLTLGQSKSLEMGANDPKDVDVMCYFGKVNHSKVKFFSLFAPEDPTQNIDWEKDGGTSPWCKFEGKSAEPDAYYALKNWKHRNHTKLEKLDGVDFDTITPEQIAALSVSESYLAENVQVGDVILFQTDEKGYGKGSKGLIKIVAIEDDPDPKKADKKGLGQYQRLTLNIKIVK